MGCRKDDACKDERTEEDLDGREEAVNEAHAKQMVILGALVSVPIMFVNVLNNIAALILVSGADFLSVFEKPQLDALAYDLYYSWVTEGSSSA